MEEGLGMECLPCRNHKRLTLQLTSSETNSLVAANTSEGVDHGLGVGGACGLYSRNYGPNFRGTRLDATSSLKGMNADMDNLECK